MGNQRDNQDENLQAAEALSRSETDGFLDQVVREFEAPLCRYVARMLNDHNVEATISDRETAPERLGLTPREIEILQLMATSQTNRDIAEQLFISEETVRTHVKRILRKLNQPNRTQAVLFALKAEIIWLE